MSYTQGGVEGHKTKASLKKAVKENPDEVFFYDTAAVPGMSPGFTGRITALPKNGTKLTVVGPNPYRERKWYATIEWNSKGVLVCT
jgi:hypothetical protein